MSTGTGGILCGYCGRPMLAGVSVGGQMYHEECTRGPGCVPSSFAPAPPLPVMHYTVPMDDERVRQIARQEIAAALANYKPVSLMTFSGKPTA